MPSPLRSPHSLRVAQVVDVAGGGRPGMLPARPPPPPALRYFAGAAGIEYSIRRLRNRPYSLSFDPTGLVSP